MIVRKEYSRIKDGWDAEWALESNNQRHHRVERRNGQNDKQYCISELAWRTGELGLMSVRVECSYGKAGEIVEK